MSIIKEFKAFALRGNVVDMAVGVIIGGAFGKIVSSMVNDILMPPIGMLLGGTDFSSLAVQIGTNPEGEPVLWKYGAFIQTCVDFIILALCVFLLVKLLSMAQRKKETEPAPAPAPSKEEVLLTEIRDLLKEKK